MDIVFVPVKPEEAQELLDISQQIAELSTPSSST